MTPTVASSSVNSREIRSSWGLLVGSAIISTTAATTGTWSTGGGAWVVRWNTFESSGRRASWKWVVMLSQVLALTLALPMTEVAWSSADVRAVVGLHGAVSLT